MLILSLMTLGASGQANLRRCYTCRSRGEKGDCRDTFIRPTPPLDLGSESTYWSHFHGSQGPETPLRGRGGPPERTLLVERLPQHSSFLVTPERQPLDFLSPERNRHTSGPDSGKRGRPRADIINNLMMEGAQSKNAIKCHICSRFDTLDTLAF